MYIIIMNHDVYNHIMMTQWDHDAPTATTQVIGHVVFRYLAIDQKPKVILAAVPGGMLLESAEFEKWISNITQTKIIKKHKKHKKHEKHNGRVWWHYFSWFLFLSLSLALFHLRPWNPRHVPRSQALHGGLSAGRFYVIQCHSFSLSLCPNMSKQMHINIINTLWWSMMNFAPLEFRNFLNTWKDHPWTHHEPLQFHMFHASTSSSNGSWPHRDAARWSVDKRVTSSEATLQIWSCRNWVSIWTHTSYVPVVYPFIQNVQLLGWLGARHPLQPVGEIPGHVGHSRLIPQHVHIERMITWYMHRNSTWITTCIHW